MTQQIHDSAKSLKIFLIAGEASGDVIGGKLMQAMKSAADERGYTITFDGIGGEHMAAAGLKTRFPMRELSLIGIAEILPHLPKLLRRIKETVTAIRHEQPDMLITIDAPAFGLRVARRLGKSAKTLRVHYVAPQHWAWRPGRAKSLKHETDLLLALLPFEPAFFAQYGVTCHYVGHPAIEAFQQSHQLRGNDDDHNFRQKYQIADHVKIILLLPGSRHSEFLRLMPQFTATLHQLAAEWPVNTPPPVVILPLTAASAEICQSQPHWQENLSKLPFRLLMLPPDQDADKWDGFAAASVNGAALAASGTVTLELALAGVPTVLAYRLSWFSFLLVKLLVRVPHVGLANIIANREIMPEFLQSRCRPDLLAAGLRPLLFDAAARKIQSDGMAAVKSALMGEENQPATPILRAAKLIFSQWLGRKLQ